MVERNIKGRYFIAFVLTASIFIIGILIGNLMGQYKVSKIYESQRDLTTQFLTQGLQSDLLLETPCNFINNELVSSDLFNVGRRLDALERERGSKDLDVISLKKYYTALQLRDYLYFKKANTECNSSYLLNLFFYSNDKDKCPECGDQGLILTYARNKNKKLRTYSFDVDVDSPLINYLIKGYNITSVPSVSFNDKLFFKFVDKNETMDIIEQK